MVERSLKRNPERRLVIAIDDLDKRDPATVRALLENAQSTLKLPCSFVLTGHPLGILRNMYSSVGGIFDRLIDLEPFTMEDRRTILAKYLAAGRVKGANVPELHPFTEEAAAAILRVSFGIPRTLNRICDHILERAAELRFEQIGAEELRTTWGDVRHRLSRVVQPEFAALQEIVREQAGDMDPTRIPDEVFDRLGVDSYVQLLALMEAAVRQDVLVAVEQRGETRFLPQPLLEDPPVADENTVDPNP